MPRGPSERSLAEARSLLLKSHLAHPPKRGYKTPIVVPQYSDDELRPLAGRRGLRLLHQMSRRADASLRRHPNQAEALAIVLLARRSGVLDKHLTVLPSARTLWRVAERGTVRSETEANLVEAVLLRAELSVALGPWADVLGSALDPWLRRKPR
jgi:hypothetical protein